MTQKQIIAPFDHTDHHNPSKLWSKAATDDPLHGEWHSYLGQNNIDNWDIDLGKGLVFTWAPSKIGEDYNSVNLEIPFDVPESGDYVFLCRLFENQRGGEIQVQFDNTSHIVNTEDQLNGFSWKQLGNLSLQEGQHNITLTNLEGFNAVNLFALVPKRQYEIAQNEMITALQNRKLVYVLEAESDFHSINAEASNKYGTEASNGAVLELNQTSQVYDEIELPKTDDYIMAIRSKGNFNITINEKTHLTNSATLDWTYIGPIHFERGKYAIEITPTSVCSGEFSDVDVVWLYSVQDAGDTLEDVFAVGESSAEVVSYRKFDSTRYVVTVDASEPFLLCFAEAYDSLWVADVNGERVGAVPVFSLVNGFWVNQSGVLEVTIEYSPQEWFYYGATLTVTVLIVCLTYFFYNWIRTKATWKRVRSIINHLYS